MQPTNVYIKNMKGGNLQRNTKDMKKVQRQIKDFRCGVASGCMTFIPNFIKI